MATSSEFVRGVTRFSMAGAVLLGLSACSGNEEAENANPLDDIINSSWWVADAAEVGPLLSYDVETSIEGIVADSIVGPLLTAYADLGAADKDKITKRSGSNWYMMEFTNLDGTRTEFFVQTAPKVSVPYAEAPKPEEIVYINAAIATDDLSRFDVEVDPEGGHWTEMVATQYFRKGDSSDTWLSVQGGHGSTDFNTNPNELDLDQPASYPEAAIASTQAVLTTVAAVLET